MPRRETLFVVGNYYHIYNRGSNRALIFFEEENYLFFLKRWREYVFQYVDVIAYCLMPTHYHFLVRIHRKTSEVSRTSEVSEISRSMQKFSISYTKAINKRFERVGPLFQGAFQAKMIKSQSQLLHLCRYIHANPVKDGLVPTPGDWPYSNYLEWNGERQGTLVDRIFIRETFNTSVEYAQFVDDFIKTRHLPDEIGQYLDKLES